MTRSILRILGYALRPFVFRWRYDALRAALTVEQGRVMRLTSRVFDADTEALRWRNEYETVRAQLRAFTNPPDPPGPA